MKISAQTRWPAVLAYVSVSLVLCLRAGRAAPEPREEAVRPQTTKYTVQSIAAAMGAARAQYNNITVRYSDEMPDFDPKSLAPSGTVTYSVVYKRLEAGAVSELVDFTIHCADAQHAPRQKPLYWKPSISNGLVAFDGMATLRLDRDPDAKGRPRALILPGRDRASFPKPPSAFALIFDWYACPWSELIGDASNHFEVKSVNEAVDGVKTVRLSGKNNAGPISIWVAPGRGFLPVRVDTDLDGEAPLKFRRTYHGFRRLPGDLWFPTKIIATELGSGTVETIAINETTIGDVGEEAFHPDLPPKTLVTDRVSGTTFQVPDVAGKGSANTSNHLEKDLDDFARSANDLADKEHSATQGGSAKPNP